MLDWKSFFRYKECFCAHAVFKNQNSSWYFFLRFFSVLLDIKPKRYFFTCCTWNVHVLLNEWFCFLFVLFYLEITWHEAFNSSINIFRYIHVENLVLDNKRILTVRGSEEKTETHNRGAVTQNIVSFGEHKNVNFLV